VKAKVVPSNFNHKENLWRIDKVKTTLKIWNSIIEDYIISM